MGALSMLVLLLTHPLEFRTLLQYKIWHEANRDITSPSEWKNSGWDRQSMRRCWDFLDLTSRSFSGVIKELEGDLARIVSVCILKPENLHRGETLFLCLSVRYWHAVQSWIVQLLLYGTHLILVWIHPRGLCVAY